VTKSTCIVRSDMEATGLETPEELPWPRKTREIRNCICDSTRWNGFKFRNSDIIVATYAKSGTTWMQQIVGQLIFRGAQCPLLEVSAWVESCATPLEEVVERLEAQKHRRFLKTHLPLDALVFSPEAKYIYVGRDGRDALWSLYNHHAGLSDRAYEFTNNTPARIGPPLEPPTQDVVQYFREWLAGTRLPFCESFWAQTQAWWDARHLPNVLLVHFNNLKADLPAQMRKIASFLGTVIDETSWGTLVEHCTFDHMRDTAQAHSPALDWMFQEGAHTFFYRGTNGRWREVLSAEDVLRYEEAARTNLTSDCAHWIATGEIRA
jgi:aryl sulfotransferase